MSRSVPRESPGLVVTVVAALAMLLVGVWIGNGLQTEPAAAPASDAVRGDSPQTLALLSQLTDAVRALELRMGLPLPASGGSASFDLDAAPAMSSPARTLESERMPLAPTLQRTDLAGVEERLERVEAQLMVLAALSRVESGAAGQEFPLGVPWNLSTHDYLAALKSHADNGGEDQVTRAHLFWDPEQVRAMYGEPDEVAEHEDYVEWIYRLLDGESQFDFHFVNGLCVVAH